MILGMKKFTKNQKRQKKILQYLNIIDPMELGATQEGNFKTIRFLPKFIYCHI
jgi:hypothetical protein